MPDYRPFQPAARRAPRARCLLAAVLACALPGALSAGELAVEDFTFQGPQGSAGATIEKLRPGPEMGTSLGPSTDLRDVLKRHDAAGQFKPLVVLDSPLTPTHWTSGTHQQFGNSAICCEGAADIETKEENLRTGAVLIRSLAEYYKGTRP